jgi:hypothetical protein
MARDAIAVGKPGAHSHALRTADLSFSHLKHGILGEEFHALPGISGTDVQCVSVDEILNRGSRSQQFAQAGTPLN